MIKTYGKQTCNLCFQEPIATIPDRKAPPEDCQYFYRPKTSKRSKPELWNIFFPSIPHPLGICERCFRKKMGLFDLVPISSLRRTINKGMPLGHRDLMRLKKHEAVQAEDVLR